jgi:predicted dehydrogenase
VIAKTAATSGVKAIFCEKPLAVDLKSANEMVEACKENKVVLMVDHQRRFDPFYQSVKEYLQNGCLGRIQQVGFHYTAGIANTGSHMLDLLRFFFGDVDWVQGIYSANTSSNPTDPNIDGVLMFKDGLFCVIQACDVKSFLIFELDIVGTKGRLRLTHSGYAVEYYDIKDSHLFSGYNELYIRTPPIDPNIPREPMVSAVQHLVGCLEHGHEPISSGIDGKKALELIVAFHESVLRNGEKINLPLQNSNVTLSSK